MDIQRHSNIISAGLAVIGVLAILVLCSSTQASESILHNGIQVPDKWPPEIRHFSREPMEVPYLRNPPEVIPIDVGRQLFVDDFLIENTTLERTFHKAEIHPASPVLKPDKPWESRQISPRDPPQAMPFSDGVWYDPADKLYKMWYVAGFNACTCYAVSEDGVHWEKPVLDVEPGTNIVEPGGRDSSTVWLDHHAKDPRERFKLMRRDNATYTHQVHFSPDGIHWTDPAATTGASFDRSTFFYNPFRGVWVFSIRAGAYAPKTETVSDEFHDSAVFEKTDGLRRLPRMRRYAENKDFLAAAQSWPSGEKEFSPSWWKSVPAPTMWLGADELDPPRPDVGKAPELYNLDAVGYESLMVGLFSIWRGRTKDYPARGKINEICVGFSRDGFHWDRPSREPIVPVSEDPQAWNHSNVQSAGGCFLVVGDKLYFYVSGRTVRDIRVRKGFSSTGLATLRRDGFASMDAADERGELTTRPLRFSGKHLFVNLEAAEGQLQVEILDEDSEVIPPFARKNCVPLSTDETLVAVHWEGTEDLSAIRGKPVRLRFILERGHLYSFWVSPDESGASYGYVAAGGPGFCKDIDTVGASGYPKR